ncbi:MAG: glutathione transferase GstA [Pseudomonas sp.]|nr:glutathione transferase GstA [Pseudomonas sp.]
MKLYYAPRTCSLSPHIVLQELDLPFELIRVNNQTKLTAQGEDFRLINPKGYVAALQLDDGRVLTEGPAIVQYLADLKPEQGLAPPPGSWQRVRLQEWLNFIACELHGGLAPLFNPTLAPVREVFIQRLQLRFALLDQHLAQQAWLLGETFGVADAYLFTVMGWACHLDIDLAPWPALQHYLQRLARRPSVLAALAGEA